MTAHSLGYREWDDIVRRLFFLIELCGAIFMSGQIHFHMYTHLIKNCQFRSKADYDFNHKADSCTFSDVSHPNWVTTARKLLKIGENLKVTVARG